MNNGKSNVLIVGDSVFSLHFFSKYLVGKDHEIVGIQLKNRILRKREIRRWITLLAGVESCGNSVY